MLKYKFFAALIFCAATVSTTAQLAWGLTDAERQKLQTELTAQTDFLRKHPERCDWYWSRAVTLHSLGEYERALKDINTAVMLEPDNALYHKERAEIFIQKNNYKEALADLNETLKIEPQNAEAYEEKGDCLIALKRSPEAILSFDKCLNLKPSARVYALRGACRFEDKQYEQGLADENKALSLEPGNSTAKDFKQRILTEAPQLATKR